MYFVNLYAFYQAVSNSRVAYLHCKVISAMFMHFNLQNNLLLFCLLLLFFHHPIVPSYQGLGNHLSAHYCTTIESN